MNQRDGTRICVLTPGGRGAVAVVAVAGDEATKSVDQFFLAANRRSLDEQPVGGIVYGHWGSREGEDLVVCRRDENRVEIHCHGGRQSSAQIVGDLAEAGCTEIHGERWLVQNHECPIASAAHLALTRATTQRAAELLLAQYHGALRREIAAIAAVSASGDSTETIGRLERLLQYADLGLHLTEPWRVVIAGQPNVGKSSLINALFGFERAIVFDQPGTTRDVVTSTTAIDGWPVELSDTAGLHQSENAIETAGISLARKRLAATDLIVWVLDATELNLDGDCSIWDRAQQQAQDVGDALDSERTLLVVNKIDLASFVSTDDPVTVGTCAVTGEGVEQLLTAIAVRLVPNVPPSSAAVPFTNEHVEAFGKALDVCRQGDSRACETVLRNLLGSG